MKTLIGMSGGVDSAVTAALVSKSENAAGITLKLYDGDNPQLIQKFDREAQDAADVCKKLNIDHTVLDLKTDFYNYVIKHFIDEYIAGRTPNPCIQCNIHIKFGAMLQYAQQNGFDSIATGHYARVEKQGDKYLLKKALDSTKDQSYVLYGLTQEQLSKTVLPLGDYTKAQAREIAENMKLCVARKSDSQDICFVPDGDYAAFIERSTGVNLKSGNYLDLSGNILGKHKGIIHYTIGQRKGLGIALGKHAFVLNKNANTNEVILGDEEHLFYKQVEVSGVNIIAADNLDGICAAGKLRYRHQEQPCKIHQTAKNTVILEFDIPQRAPSPGQAAVFYDGDVVLGGGIIVKGIK
ncbi:MAG: tRNA 2-thiouridine(34) synthase MnmA [Clostridia bacterium]|nr:tRNA 2-thiouridine(34) synthase MnmA [Clostridia bacterium]